ncbi:MAG TPA: MerR family transcriptional regulator [Bacteroidia bacterium]|nr:MerR family transcriptional regulator [Bacteroidia bacterium]
MGVNEKEETQKLYYSITEVSEMFDLNASTLRFWEKEFEVLKPTKNKKGNRVFTQKDIDYIGLIVDLVKHQGFTIHGAKEQLKHKAGAKPKGEKNTEVIEKLKAIKAKLIDLRDKENE